MIELIERFSDKRWRMNHLYWIINKKGRRVQFRFNVMQERMFDELWYMNVILKARQFGVTTFIDIYFLDECVFHSNVEAGIIAHNREDAAKIFRRKVQYPYRSLPPDILSRVKAVADSRQELALSNNSTIYVGTSMRSGTLQYLHVSEHGKICRKYPEKAEEIRTGSLNAVEVGQIVAIESTAEGSAGDFFEFCGRARDNIGKDLSPLDWKFLFFPWYENREYSMDIPNLKIPPQLDKYFNGLERSLSIKLSKGQRSWYVKKKEILGVKMKQEYPSTPEEAFEGAAQYFSFFVDHHVIEPIPVPQYAPLYMTFDWGFGKPFSVGYWWIDGDGRAYRFSEIYGCSSDKPDTGLRYSDPEIAELIIGHEEKLGINPEDFIARICDPACFNKKPNYSRGGQSPSTAEVFSRYGIHMTPGDSSRKRKWREFNARLRLLDDTAPMLQVYSTCKAFIRTIPLMMQDLKKPEDIDTTLEDHIADESALLFTARPICLEEPELEKSYYDRRIERLQSRSVDDYEDIVLRDEMNMGVRHNLETYPTVFK